MIGLVQDTDADVCLLDIEMPGLDGITVAAEPVSYTHLTLPTTPYV